MSTPELDAEILAILAHCAAPVTAREIYARSDLAPDLTALLNAVGRLRMRGAIVMLPPTPGAAHHYALPKARAAGAAPDAAPPPAEAPPAPNQTAPQPLCIGLWPDGELSIDRGADSIALSAADADALGRFLFRAGPLLHQLEDA